MRAKSGTPSHTHKANGLELDLLHAIVPFVVGVVEVRHVCVRIVDVVELDGQLVRVRVA